MRFLVIVVIAFAWLAGWLTGERERGGQPPRSHVAEAHDAVGATSESADADPAERSRLVSLWDGLRGVKTPPEPLPDHLVNCDLGSSRTFMRESKCLVVGRVAESRWTILD